MQHLRILMSMVMFAAVLSCSTNKKESDPVVIAEESGAGKIKLIILDPGHFHAALLQRSMYENVDTVVHVFAPEGEDVKEYLKRIETYNTRPDDPTHWRVQLYTGPDYFEKMLTERPGNVVVLSGNNKLKAEYIKASIDSGLNVLSDKPMAIHGESFDHLKESFGRADINDVVLYDIMTERFEITNLLQREFSTLPEIFGTLQTGTKEDPAVRKESIHHFFKSVSGSALKRPAWFFDVEQQGDGIVDITTHFVDLVQWQCFPDQIVQYKSDINVTGARRWKTTLTPAQFEQVTHMKTYPDYLKKDVDRKGMLGVYSNGEINYQIKGIHARVSVLWNFEAPAGGGDTHFSIMKGSKANLLIRQGKEENYKPLLYVEPAQNADVKEFESNLKNALAKIQSKYPGVDLQKSAGGWSVIIPEKYHIGHEAHFALVTKKYLDFLRDKNMPAWEIPNMLAKYYTTTRAVEMAKGKQ